MSLRARVSFSRSLWEGRFPTGVFSLLFVLVLVGTGCDAIGGGEDDTTPPSAPASLETVSGDARVSVGWHGVEAEDLEGFNVYRDTSSIEEVAGRDPLNTEVLPDTSYTDDSVENGTVYYYRVTAVDEAENESDPSGEVSVRPFGEPPTRPES